MATITVRKGKRGPSYQARVRVGGYPTQVKSFSRRVEAERWAALTEARIVEGELEPTARKKELTLGNLIERYEEEIIPFRKDSKTRMMQLNWWLKDMGNRKLSTITPAAIARHRDRFHRTPLESGKPRSGATANRYVAALSHLFTTAVKDWGVMNENPVHKVRRLQESRGRTMNLSPEEIEKLLSICKRCTGRQERKDGKQRAEPEDSYLYVVVVLALATGMRKGEILSLKWKDVDFKHERIILENTKNGERRAVQLAGLAFDTLREFRREQGLRSPLVFPSKRNQGKTSMLIEKRWRAARKKAGLTDFRFHDLRHVAASNLAMAGATLPELAEFMGHKDFRVVKRYTHYTETHVKKVVAKMVEQSLPRNKEGSPGCRTVDNNRTSE